MAKALLEMGDDRRRPDRRHHGRPAAASAEAHASSPAPSPAAAPPSRRAAPSAKPASNIRGTAPRGGADSARSSSAVATLDLSRPRSWASSTLRLTPFPTAGRFLDPSRAPIAHARNWSTEGADIVDIGGESSRPGAAPVSEAEELERVLPVVEALADDGAPVIIDTMKPDVMRAAIDAGRLDGQRRRRADGARRARGRSPHDAGVCLMHMQGEPRTMQQRAALRRRRARGAAISCAARASAAKRRASRASGSCSIPGSASARPWSTTSSCCGSCARSWRSGFRCSPAFAQVHRWAKLTGRDWRAARGSVAAALLAVERGATNRARPRRACETARRVRGLAGRPEASGASVASIMQVDARKYFGTDGVRGRVGEPPDHARLRDAARLAAGEAHAGAAARRASTPRVLIGKDTRISGYMLEAALEAGLSAAGVDVLPVRAAADARHRLPHARAAAVGRHRDQRVAQPVRRQRHQVLLGDGAKLPDEAELAIERAMDEPMACVPSAELGKARRVDDAGGPLHRVLQEHVSRPSSTCRG